MKSKPTNLPVLGVTVIGERGQIVIPKDMRDQMGLSKGDQIMLMYHNDSVMIIPRDKMEHFINHVATGLKLSPKAKK